MPEQEDLSCCVDKVRDPLVRGAGEGLPWQVGTGIPCWARPGSGPGHWSLGGCSGGGGVVWWHSNIPAKYSSLLALLEASCSAGTWTWEPRPRGGRGTGPVLGGSAIQDPPTASHPSTPFRNLWRAPRWNCVSTCACFHLCFQHKREAPQVGRRACVVLGRNCMGPGMWMRPHTPTRRPVERAQGRAPLTSHLPPELLPLPLGSGKMGKKGNSEGRR